MGGSSVLLGEAAGGAVLDDDDDDDDDGDGDGLAVELVGEGVVGDGVVGLLLRSPPEVAVVTGSSPPRVRSHPPTSTAATTHAARRTQKPRSGVGWPVPGTPCRPTSRRYRALARRRRNQPTPPATKEAPTKMAATPYDTVRSRSSPAAR